MKMLIGFFFGILISGALAKDIAIMNDLGEIIAHAGHNYVNAVAAVTPDGRMMPIKIDAQGYVICSTEQAK
jgi:hypothetical protein